MRERRRATATSTFGAGRRESHDSSDFYARFTQPEVSDDETIRAANVVDKILCDDAAAGLKQINDNCVALVVTSPPYFAGKEYEQALGEGHVPGTYLEFLGMLRNVFEECVRVLEPGGRIAVNVANLGRKPYRSLSADVIRILQDDLKLLLRGEIIWHKADGATNSTAWGSFQSPANPVLRDLTERVVVASKGRFGRALRRPERRKENLAYEITIAKDDFMELTTDVWRIESESATRVGHPAPFPVALPQRLIDLYTFRHDLVLDPFMGSGSTAVAAVNTDRHFLGFDTDPDYVRLARQRVADARAARRAEAQGEPLPRVLIGLPDEATDDHGDSFQRRASKQGQAAREIAREAIIQCGFEIEGENRRLPGGIEVNFTAWDAQGELWYFDVSGAFTSSRPGLRRTDTVFKALGRAAVLKAKDPERCKRLILLSTHLPEEGSSGFGALEAARGQFFHDAIPMLSRQGLTRLARYAKGEGKRRPLGALADADHA